MKEFRSPQFLYSLWKLHFFVTPIVSSLFHMRKHFVPFRVLASISHRMFFQMRKKTVLNHCEWRNLTPLSISIRGTTYLTRTKHIDNKNIERAVESSVKFIRNKSFGCQGIIKIKVEEEKIPGRWFFKTVKFPLLQTMADENLINRFLAPFQEKIQDYSIIARLNSYYNALIIYFGRMLWTIRKSCLNICNTLSKS